jgi:hypothetical protein
MPGFRYSSDVGKHPVSECEISEANAKLAARRGTYIAITLGGAVALDPAQRSEQDDLNKKNLKVLLRHHVSLALRSDSYRQDTILEAIYISSLHAMDNKTLLNLWRALAQRDRYF